MRVLIPDFVWARDHARPDRIHLWETRDGTRRTIDLGDGHGVRGVAVCRAILRNEVVDDPRRFTLMTCEMCVEVRARLGGPA